jgi:hypothetical protein
LGNFAMATGAGWANPMPIGPGKRTAPPASAFDAHLMALPGNVTPGQTPSVPHSPAEAYGYLGFTGDVVEPSGRDNELSPPGEESRVDKGRDVVNTLAPLVDVPVPLLPAAESAAGKAATSNTAGDGAAVPGERPAVSPGAAQNGVAYETVTPLDGVAATQDVLPQRQGPRLPGTKPIGFTAESSASAGGRLAARVLQTTPATDISISKRVTR